jgi:hypothetical protein
MLSKFSLENSLHYDEYTTVSDNFNVRICDPFEALLLCEFPQYILNKFKNNKWIKVLWVLTSCGIVPIGLHEVTF